jgi:hypothetical protein
VSLFLFARLYVRVTYIQRARARALSLSLRTSVSSASCWRRDLAIHLCSPLLHQKCRDGTGVCVDLRAFACLLACERVDASAYY